MRLITLITLMAFACTAFSAEAPPGMNAASQLRFGIGARALGMGSAFTAIAAGPLGIYWNPAALARTDVVSFTGMYTEPFGGGIEGIGYSLQFLGLSGGFEDLGYGIGWFNSHVSDIPWTDSGGSFDYDSSIYFLSLALKEAKESVLVSVGGTLKVYRDSMLTGSALGFGFDLGVMVDLGNLLIAYCSQDVGRTKYRWQGTGQEPVVFVPWIHRIGIAFSLFEEMLRGAVDLAIDPEALLPLLWRLGLEFSPVEWLALRGGLRLDPFAESYHTVFTLGIGVSPWEKLSLDYAFLINPLPAEGLSTNTHVFSVTVEF